MWDGGDWSMQPSLNFQGSGVTPWIQPTIDSTLLNMQPDMYQPMAAAALQEIRCVDPSKQTSPTIMQFQQPENVPGNSISILPSQVLQQVQSQSQQASFQINRDNLCQAQVHSYLLPSQLLSKPCNDQHQHLLVQQLGQQQRQHFPQELHQQQPSQQQNQQEYQQPAKRHHPNQEMTPQHLSDQQMPQILSDLSQLVSASQSHSSALPNSTFIQHASFQDSTSDVATTSVASPLDSILSSFSPEEHSHLLNIQRSNLVVSSGSWLPKRIGVTSPIISAVPCSLPHVDQLGSPHTNISQPPATLSPLMHRGPG